MNFWVRAIRSPLRLLPAGMVLPILTGRLRGRKWIVGSCVHSCWIGSYEFDKQRAFAEVTGRGATVLDLGSNVGFYTLLAAELMGFLAMYMRLSLYSEILNSSGGISL